MMKTNKNHRTLSHTTDNTHLFAQVFFMVSVMVYFFISLGSFLYVVDICEMAKCEHSVTVCSQKKCTKTQDILIVNSL